MSEVPEKFADCARTIPTPPALPALSTTNSPSIHRHQSHARHRDAWMDIYDEIQAERERAHAKHGPTSMESAPADDPTGRRFRILAEEVGEVAREFNDAEHDQRPVDLAALRAELVQVAAMAVAWVDVLPVEVGVGVSPVEQRDDPDRYRTRCSVCDGIVDGTRHDCPGPTECEHMGGDHRPGVAGSPPCLCEERFECDPDCEHCDSHPCVLATAVPTEPTGGQE